MPKHTFQRKHSLNFLGVLKLGKDENSTQNLLPHCFGMIQEREKNGFKNNFILRKKKEIIFRSAFKRISSN